MFYEFNNYNILELHKGKVISQYWMNCNFTDEELSSIEKSARIQNKTSSATSSTVSVFTLLFAFVSFSVSKKLYAV